MVTEIPAGSLTTTIENKIATIEFGHPASNSLPGELLGRLTQEFHNLSTNPAVSVIVIKSTGTGVFCAGASFDELLAVSNHEEGIRFFSGFAHLINAMRCCKQLIIGQVQGKAVGGGVGIAAACDYTFATATGAIKLSELAIGIGPFVIEPAVSRKIGKAAMGEMTLEAHKWKTPEWAHQRGLYAKVVDNQTELENEVAHLALKLASYNPEALTEMKKVLWEGTEHWETLLLERAAISGKLVLSEATKKALTQFKK